MARSNKPIVWSLFAAGGTLAAFAAPVLAAVFLAAALGHAPPGFDFDRAQSLAGHWAGKAILGGTVILFLWHAAHRRGECGQRAAGGEQAPHDRLVGPGHGYSTPTKYSTASDTPIHAR